MRAEFTQKTKDIMARRVGFRCSNPSCRIPTAGPHDDPTKYTNIGVAAHLLAASDYGPRAAPEIDSETRKNISNGIWLCQNCSVLIDRDENAFPKELLESWRKTAEEFAREELNRQIIGMKDATLIKESGITPLNENEFGEHNFGDSTVRYYMKDGQLHIEYEEEPDIVSYYVVDGAGNVVDHKFPFPLEEYTVDIDEKMILRTREEAREDGITCKYYDLKWGKHAVVCRNRGGQLVHFQVTGGTINHRIKLITVRPPNEHNI